MSGLFNNGVAAGDGLGETAFSAFDKLNAVLPVRTLTASEDLADGDFVNLHVSGGLRMRKADADDTSKPAHGFVRAAIANGATGLFFGLGLVNDHLAGLTPGTVYYLSTAAGGVTDTLPATTLNGQQELGMALSATELATVRLPILEAP